MTELTLDEDCEGPRQVPILLNSGLTNGLFIRMIGITCLIAFVSFWTQAIGLIGADIPPPVLFGST